jgi:riboflavin synthase alpha subunit
MKNVLQFLGLFAFLAVLPSAQAADVTGTWKGAFDFQGTSVPLTFHLTAAGGVVTGTIEGLPTGAAEIHDGKVDGDAITFWVNTDYEGTTYKIVYKGKISEGQIEFSFGTEDGSWGATMTVKNSDVPVAKPAAPDATGTWKGAFDFQGTNVPLTFHLTVAAGVLTGTVEGLPTTPAEIHDGKVDGDTVTFWVNTDYEGTAYKLVYKGKVTADGIKFTFGTEEGSWGAELTATKAI